MLENVEINMMNEGRISQFFSLCKVKRRERSLGVSC